MTPPSARSRHPAVRFLVLAILTAAGLTHSPAPADQLVETIIRKAEDLAHFEAFVPARTTLRTALRAAERSGDPALVARALDGIAAVLDFEGRPLEAARHHRDALRLSEQIRNRALEASIMASMGQGHWRRSDYAAALAAMTAALALQESLEDERGCATTLNLIGRVYFKQALYAEARQSYARAAHIVESLGDLRGVSLVRESQGDLALEQGFFVEALGFYQGALAARRASGDPAGEVYALHLIGRAYLVQGAFRQALDWFDEALRKSGDDDNAAGRALALYHAAIAYDGLAERERALELYAQALALKTALGDRRQQAWILARMGDSLAAGGHLSPALERYRRATRIWTEIDDPRGVATGLEKAARVELALGRHDDSIASFGRAAEILRASQPAFLPSALGGLGEAHAAAGAASPALEHGRRAVELSRRGRNDIVRWAAARSLGRIERQLGRAEQALASYRESLGIIDTLRGRVLPSADVRAGFLEGKQAVYSEAVELLLESGRVSEALEVAERARARAFLDLISTRGVRPRPLAPHGVEPSPASRLQPLSLVTGSPLRASEARREAHRRNTTILEYFSTADRVYIWVLRPDGSIHSRSSGVSRRELAELVHEARRVPSGAPASRDSSAPLRRLHDVLIDPVADLLPRSRDRLVTIVPHGPLFLVSFAALRDHLGSYLVERHTIAYSPSISILGRTGQQRLRLEPPTTSPRLVLVGNPTMPETAGPRLEPLPDAELEARAIGALYPPSQVTILIGPRAGERSVRVLAPVHTIIHLATHAVVFDDEPMSSYLALAPDDVLDQRRGEGPGDGRLTVSEVFGLNLRADLVTLSACNTGLGHLSGDGIVGLSRAFMYAGAASVLVSLWRVADPVASVQMEQFYRGLIRTNGQKAAALAAAQRETIVRLRRGAITAPSGEVLAEDPLLWAPFVLVGEGR